MRLSYFIFLMCLTLLACHNKKQNLTASANDTTKVLQTALLRGTSIHYMPDASALRIRYKFGDSILLTSWVLPLNILPSKVGDQTFKIMSSEKICQIIKQDSAMNEVPNYLFIDAFQKNDSGYFVRLESLGCRRYSGGGTLGLYFKKIKDSFVVAGTGSYSIN